MADSRDGTTFIFVVKSILRKAARYGPVLIIACALLSPANSGAQSPIVQFTANYVTAASPVSSYTAFPTSPGSFSGCSANNYTYTWSNGTNNQLKLVSFTANSKTYVISGATGVQVKLRRVNNATVSGTRNILYSESTFATATTCVTSPRQLDFKAPYSHDMASFLNDNVLNHGTDNIFTNTGNGDGNNNNIERVDVVFTNGLSSALPSDMGFVLCERGNNNAHDGFRIAAILSKNANNDPTSFGPVKTCVAGNGSNNGSWGHPSLANGNKQLAAYVLRKDAAESYLRVSSNVNQEIGGVFFSLTDLGVAANQIIYGYCLIGPDGVANPSSAQLLNLNDASVYPTATTEVAGGGLDLIAVNAFFGTNQALAHSYFENFGGSLNGTQAKLNWRLQGLAPGTIVELQRSVDASTFTTVYQYTYSSAGEKSFQDELPRAGIYYYRLCIRAGNGAEIYSHVVKLQLKTDKPSFKIYPTLTKPGTVLNITEIPSGKYTAFLKNVSGITVSTTPFQVSAGAASLNLSDRLSPGMYYLVVEKNGTLYMDVKKIIIQ